MARTHNVVTLAGSSDEDPEQERRLAATFTARRVDALIVVPSGSDHGYLRERSGGIPLVFLDRPPRFLDADAVLSDNAGGAHAAVSHLIAAEHRRIGFLGGREPIYTALERRRGYREALNEHGITEDPRLIRTDLYDAADAHAAARELLLAEPPTAIFSAQNLLSVGTVRALPRARRARGVAHVGFDDIPLGEFLDPGLTVVAQDPHALGRVAAERVFARLNGDDGPYTHIVLPTTLIPRGSGELPPTQLSRWRA